METLAMPPSLYIEVLSRLGCGNAVISGPKVELEEISMRDNTVVVGDINIRIPDKYQFDDILTGLQREDNVVNFRMKFKQNEMLPVLIENDANGIYSRERIFASPPSLTADQCYNIVCQCGGILGTVCPGRILALPPRGWRSQSLEWFCCVKHSPDKVEPKKRDILYNAFSVSVHNSNICQTVETQHCDTKNRQIVVVKCIMCDRDLGDAEESWVNLWSHNISFMADLEVSPDPTGIVPSEVFCDPNVKTPSECFNRVIRAYVREKIEKMPKFLIRNRKDDACLLWAFDSNLTVLAGNQTGVEDFVFMKILFKTTKIEGDESVDTIFLSDDLYETGLHDMVQSTRNLPQSFRFINGYQCAYIIK